MLLLLLRFEGPLQSWGIRSRWDVRDSHDEPTKSGVVGLLGCALGIPRGDRRLEELDEALRLGVRVESPGLPLVDFQTVTGTHLAADGKYRKTGGGTQTSLPDEPTTIVSPRTYLQDAAFLVVLGGDEQLLGRCADAIRGPRWPIYLGRRACPPSRPVFEDLTDPHASIEDALRHIPWSCESLLQLGGRPDGKLRCTLEDPSGNAIRSDAIRVNAARMYASRTVRVFTVDPPQEAA